jgi:large subunit ribosomal protein L15
MPLARRVPKFGFSNPDRIVYSVVNVARLQELASSNKFEGGVVTSEVLYALGVTRKRTAPVKILGNGDITVALSVTAAKVSAAARQKIESAGGAVTINE